MSIEGQLVRLRAIEEESACLQESWTVLRRDSHLK